MSAASATFASPTRAPRGTGFCCSIAAHLLVVLLLMFHFRDNTPAVTPPAALMLEYSPQLQVSQPQAELPPGINQQQQVDAAAPENTPEKEEVRQVVKADNAELRQPRERQLSRNPAKTADVQKKNLRRQERVKGNATATNRAAPQPQQIVASKTTAPIASDAAKARRSQLSWEGLVKGKLNLVKRYPPEAKRRGRAGVALVAFVVSAEGQVISRQLVRSSQTIALDRESLAMIDRAQPLPEPPAELLVAGRVSVTMPVSFALTQAN